MSIKTYEERLVGLRPLQTYVPEHLLRAEIAELRAALERKNDDAARYRWLRHWKGQEHEPPFTVPHEIDGTLWGGDLDAAIDEARKQGATQ